MLEVKNIHKRFGDNEVLKGVDFKVEKGSVIAVLATVVLEKQPCCAASVFWSGQTRARSSLMISERISLL